MELVLIGRGRLWRGHRGLGAAGRRGVVEGLVLEGLEGSGCAADGLRAAGRWGVQVKGWGRVACRLGGGGRVFFTVKHLLKYLDIMHIVLGIHIVSGIKKIRDKLHITLFHVHFCLTAPKPSPLNQLLAHRCCQPVCRVMGLRGAYWSEGVPT